MKVVAYSIKSFEKEFLAKANQKKHDITLISNPLSRETAAFAEGKDAVVVFTNDDVSAPVVNMLADMGIKYIATRSVGTDHIDKETAAVRSIKLANVPEYSPQAIAEHTLALALALSRKIIKADQHSHNFNFKLDELIGFNFSGKTVGIIGLGHIGITAGNIFRGLGCKVIGYDIRENVNAPGIDQVSLDELLICSDIISLHAPLTADTKYLINKVTLYLMKKGVMILNTSRGALVNTEDMLHAIESGHVGYFGMDVYEREKGLFFEDHHTDQFKDATLLQLLQYPNVIVTPHQAFLTNEALQQIADQTIRNLDFWQQNKCVGKSCACAKQCSVQQEIVNTKVN
ncbi:2-hydroxyacid dehydrogenase [Mucilaginibacter sp. KACC 22063]|uniref:2-hydroxyacid dehydrogenase n=1 Tax=Mucilaginibacter sp. KACC 22063 TaxID=3025666 RepID=UPI002366708D|nr:2-hydroxyacid dehydrogenase [Mucilaginibacter sp. KACC 22063]WDF57403.1 2-hydroxyacid dehydrogenase [Mucilaginibacter sp. KACC 22063]